MFDASFYLDLVNAEYERQLSAPITLDDLDGNLPCILQRLEKYFREKPLQTGVFSHFRPARYLSENSRTLAKNISKLTRDRFEQAFKQLNALL